MSTALEIITDAYRESNTIGIGVTPNEAQQAEALRRLNTVISSALGFEIGEGLVDWRVGATGISNGGLSLSENRWTRPPQNSRLLLAAQTPQTIFLPASVDDGARLSAMDMLGTLATYPVTLDGNGMKIEGQPSIVLNENSTNKTWFYRADLGSWMLVSTLLIDTEMPFPAEFDDAFILLLAMRLNPRMGRSMDAQSDSWLGRSLSQLQARYRQKPNVPADYGVVAMTSTGYGHGLGGPTGDFQYPFGWMS